jgi:quercetin dioxygenase-like cupin family protein
MIRAEHQPMGQLYLYGGVYVREMLTPDAGTLIPQHKHRYDHLSYVAAGAVRVWRGDELLGDFAAPCAVRIEANAAHRFLTLVDGTLVLCIHATDAAEVEIAEEHQFDFTGGFTD